MKNPISGIYSITNKVNKKRYIGSSKNIHLRWDQDHVPSLNNGTHENRHLQSAWNKYGSDNFEFTVVEPCCKNFFLEREGYYIELHKSWEREHGYNFTRIINEKVVLSDETKKLMSEIKQQPNYWSSGVNALILDLFKQGKSKNGIATTLGVSRASVYSCLMANGLHAHNRKKHTNFIKLTDDVKEKIQKLRSNNKSWEEISKIVNIGKTQLLRVGIMGDGTFNSKTFKRKAYRISLEIIEKAKSLRETTTMTWDQIADALDVSRVSLYNLGITKLYPECSKKIQNKVTEENRILIKNLKNQGKLVPEISRITGTPQSTIRLILKP